MPVRVAGVLLATGALLIGVIGPLDEVGTTNLIEVTGCALLLIGARRLYRSTEVLEPEPR